MVHDQDRDAVTALQIAQIGQQWRDFSAGVLVDAMQAHERVQDQQARLQSGDRLGETVAIGFAIEAKRWRGNHLNVEIGERDADGFADAVETLADNVQCVLGGVEQDAA